MDRRLVIALVAIIVIGGIFFVVRSQSSHHAAKHLTFQLRIQKNTMSPSDISATQGDTVTLHVTADAAFELHLHGYNRKLELKPGKTSTLTFKADTAGSFEMENEDTSHHLGTLTVNPS
jgi:plastocyanin